MFLLLRFWCLLVWLTLALFTGTLRLRGYLDYDGNKKEVRHGNTSSLDRQDGEAKASGGPV